MRADAMHSAANWLGPDPARWPARVELMDVAPRDGLQNESGFVSTADKLALIAGLAEAGLRRIEVTSFVSPKAVPQLADAAELVAALPPRPGVDYYALVPNEKGYDRAIESGLRHIALVMSVTETMNRRNIGLGVAESVAIAGRLIERAKSDRVNVRVYVSVAFICPFEGKVAPARAIELTDRFLAMGAGEACLTDAVGRANPAQVAEVFAPLVARHGPERLAAHFHNTHGMALANTLTALQQGICRFDASVGGLGGCPFSPGATGNTPTEDLVNFLHGMGIETGVDLEKLCDVTERMRAVLGRVPPAAYFRATRLKQAAE